MGMWSPATTQFHQLELQVVGELPPILQGSYYRNGPNPLVLNQPGYHQFDGDGMIHCVRFEAGKAYYSNRWIATEKFNIESHFKKKIFYYYREYIEIYAEKIGMKGRKEGPANTSVLFFNEKLYALHESSVPLELNPVTLDVIGKWDFLGDESWQPMTAHPKICPLTQELHTFSYEPLKNKLTYYCLDQFGTLINQFPINLPYSALLVHDFIVTSDFVIFMFFPLIIESSLAIDKAYDITWRPEHQSWVAVYDKKNGKQVIEHAFEAFYSYHFINAYQLNDFIVIDLFLYEVEMESEAFWEPLDKLCHPYRMEINTTKNEYTLVKLSDLSGDFATISPQQLGCEYDKFAMCAAIGAQSKKYEYNAIVEFDLINNTYQHYDFGDHACCSEPLLIEAVDNSANKGSAFILTLVYDKKSDSSQLAIFESTSVKNGPICRLLTNTRIPFGLHGQWVPQKEHY